VDTLHALFGVYNLNTKNLTQYEKSYTLSKGDILIMLGLFVVSGNPAMSFGLPHQPFYVAMAVLFFCLMAWRRVEIVSMPSIPIFIFFAFILIYQSYALSFLSVVTILGVFMRLFIAYAAVKLVKKFAHTYVDVIYWLVILSFIFHIPRQIGIALEFDFPAMFRFVEPLFGEPQGWRMTLFLHTFINTPGMEYRNAGLFWEPGAFAGYLTLGLIFLSSIRNDYNNRVYLKRLTVLSLGLLSTFSTTSYVVFPLAMMLHLHVQGKTAILKALQLLVSIYFIIVGAIVFYAFVWEQPFMKNKIYNSIYVTQYRKSNWEADRIGTILFDLDYIQERPLTGWGWHEYTRHSLHPFLTGLIEKGRGNGMSDFTAKMGLPALLIWMYFVFKYLFILSGNNLIRGGIGLLCIMVILNGECYLGYPLFMCFFFLSKTISVEQNFLSPAQATDNHLFAGQTASHLIKG